MPRTAADTSATPTDAFCSSAIWTGAQIAYFFRHCRDPRRSAAAWLTRRVKDGLLKTVVVDTYRVPQLSRPLHIHRPGWPKPDFHKLAYELELRWSVNSIPTRVYFPSRVFGRVHGTWTGCNLVPEPNKAAHNLLVSSVWLIYLKQNPDLALYHWTADRRLQFEHRRGRHSGPIPDGLIRTERRTTAIEVGGRYPEATIRRHAERVGRARSETGRAWHWVLW